MPDYSTVYVEKDILRHPRTEAILKKLPRAQIIRIDDYHAIFNRRRQNYALQHASKALILAENHDELIHSGSPVCQSFDHRWFYYCTTVMNCVYDCGYCWLKGLYASGNLVIFVNIEDIFSELEKMLREHPVYLCVSYDTDLLALDSLTGYARLWASFAASHEDLTIEIRTKGCGTLPQMDVSDRTILAFTVSPERETGLFEKSAPSLGKRVSLLQEAMRRGFPVRLCLDPVLVCAGWKKDYREMMDHLHEAVDLTQVMDFSVGTFRLSAEYMKRMRRQDPGSAILQYPYDCSDGFFHLPDRVEKDTEQYVIDLLKKYVPEERIFVWREL